MKKADIKNNKVGEKPLWTLFHFAVLDTSSVSIISMLQIGIKH
jgi:hypothetical protein